jgi:serine protease Do
VEAVIILPVKDKLLVGIIEKASPSVVNINTVMLVHDAYMNVVPLQGVGSGIVIDPKGYIMTNHHIAQAAQSMVVSMFDGTRLEGKPVGTDPTTDVAVIRVDPGSRQIPVAELGDSDGIRVGQMAIAIGNPFGFMLHGPTVTVGVISALNRTIQAEGGVFENLIQTDAHINPGNSGGPLLNGEGKVIGMNSANIPFAQGIGFSIPINLAMRIAKELVDHGRVIRPWLGIFGIGLTKEVTEYYNLGPEEGVLVTRSFENGPAGQQGIAPGDIILSIDGRRIKDMSDLGGVLQDRKIGDVITLGVLRGNRKREVKVKLAETPTG